MIYHIQTKNHFRKIILFFFSLQFTNPYRERSVDSLQHTAEVIEVHDRVNMYVHIVIKKRYPPVIDQNSCMPVYDKIIGDDH